MILGVFKELDATVETIETLREAGFKDITVYSPIPRHELDEVLKPKTSHVRLFTLIGGIIGCLSGFALTIWTSLEWPIRTSAKPIVSLPPYVIIAFELTILFGALGTLLGLFLTARLPAIKFNIEYDQRFSEDRFGIMVKCRDDQIRDAMEILMSSGAEDIRR